MKILVIEDDKVIAAFIRKGLEHARFTVETAADGATGLRMALQGEYGLILLDLMLPGRDGWTVCAALRERRITTPILMLTARDAVDDRVRGLETGADDYLVKPFDFNELLARVRALLRRDKIHKARHIRIADLEIDTTASRVFRAGQEIQLTPREYSLLETLATNEGRILSREAIQARLWMEESIPVTVNVHISNLRRKVDADHPVKLIHTVHRVGYMLRAADPEER